MWLCGSCRGKVEKNIVTDVKLEERCKAIMTAFEQRLANIESELSAKCDENDVRRIVNEEIKKTTVEPLTTPIIVHEDQTTVILLLLHSFYIAHYLILKLFKALYIKKINKMKLKLQKAKSNIQNKTIHR